MIPVLLVSAMSTRNIQSPDSRQRGFDFEFLPEAPLGAAAGFDQASLVTISIPVPRVLVDGPIQPPAKVKSVFELFFEGHSHREALKSSPVTPKRKFEPKDYPDSGESNFDWTEQEMIRLHGQLLDQHIDVFSSNRTSRESKVDALPWIFGEPEVQRERVSSDVVSYALAHGFEHNIPFTFACACYLTGHDPDEVRSLLKQQLLDSGDADLLALI